jgi:hypothetical protein
MRVTAAILVLPFLFTCRLVASTDAVGKSGFSGRWALQQDDSVELILEQTSDSIQLREAKSGATRTEYTCNTHGKECPAKDAGHSAKVSLWFNGPKLVEIMAKGREVTRRRYSITNDGSTLRVEVSPMSGVGKNETLVYTRH